MGAMIRLTLRLPRTVGSVPLIRRFLDGALAALGVAGGCRADIELAVAEACANVVRHAGPSGDYEVTMTVDATDCVVAVVDGGPGFAFDERQAIAPAATTSESGRGMHLIRSVVDTVSVHSVRALGTTVRFTKRLEWVSGAAGFTPAWSRAL